MQHEALVQLCRNEPGLAVRLEDTTLTQAVPTESAADAVVELTLDPGPGQRELELVLVEANRRLSGRGVDGRGFPVEGALVVARSPTEASAIVRRVVAAADGTFLVEGLASGPVAVEA